MADHDANLESLRLKYWTLGKNLKFFRLLILPPLHWKLKENSSLIHPMDI
jgi:hypothetical protein